MFVAVWPMVMGVTVGQFILNWFKSYQGVM